MRNFLKLVMVLFCTAILLSCTPAAKSIALPASIQIGGIYYTQVVMHYEKDQYHAANYQLGKLLPVNSEVKLITVQEQALIAEIETSDDNVEFLNDQVLTGGDILQFFEKHFAKQPVNIDKFTPMEKQHIQTGTVAKGMRKAAVIIAKGYPPVSATPSLASNTWKYWWSQWATYKVEFADDVVVSVSEKTID